MGKVVKAVAVIAVAAAIAYFAPAIGAGLLKAVGVTLVAGSAASFAATAAVSAVLSIAAAAAYQAISWKPADGASGYRRATWQKEATGLRWIEVPPLPPVAEALSPIEPRRWWQAFFWPRQRFTIIRLAGNCMDGVLPDDHGWALVDRLAAIQPGDLFAFDLDDLWVAYRPDMAWAWWWRWFSLGMVKRYLGTDPAWGRIVFDCTNPPTLCETGRNRVRFAYRVRATGRSWLACWRARHG